MEEDGVRSLPDSLVVVDVVLAGAVSALREARSSLSEDGSPAAAIEYVRQVQLSLDGALSDLVCDLRVTGWSWVEIGRVLGVSKQAAQKRFSDLPGMP